jgi:hypothetical protein
VIQKLKNRFGVQKCIFNALKDPERSEQELDRAEAIITKFIENFFIKDLIEKSD